MKLNKIPKSLITLTSVFTFLIISCKVIPDDVENNEIPSGLLTAPTNITVVKTNEIRNEIKISWIKTCYSSNTFIYYSKVNDPSTAALLGESKGSAFYKTTLKENATYYFWAKASNGNSKNSSMSSFSQGTRYEFSYTDLPVPTNVKASKISGWQVNDIKITWDSSADFSTITYIIYQNNSNAPSTANIAGYISNLTEYTTTLSTNGNYYFWVVSADSYPMGEKSNYSEVSNEIKFVYENY